MLTSVLLTRCCWSVRNSSSTQSQNGTHICLCVCIRVMLECSEQHNCNRDLVHKASCQFCGRASMALCLAPSVIPCCCSIRLPAKHFAMRQDESGNTLVCLVELKEIPVQIARCPLTDEHGVGQASSYCQMQNMHLPFASRPSCSKFTIAHLSAALFCVSHWCSCFLVSVVIPRLNSNTLSDECKQHSTLATSVFC